MEFRFQVICYVEYSFLVQTSRSRLVSNLVSSKCPLTNEERYSNNVYDTLRKTSSSVYIPRRSVSGTMRPLSLRNSCLAKYCRSASRTTSLLLRYSFLITRSSFSFIDSGRLIVIDSLIRKPPSLRSKIESGGTHNFVLPPNITLHSFSTTLSRFNYTIF